MDELVMRDDRRPSPLCWRIRMALAHKGLAYSTVPVKFTDKDKIAFANTEQVPVLVDFGEVVTDSWAIAKYLDDNDYQERLLLLGGGTKFVNQWADTQLHPALIRVVLKDTYDHVDPADREFFRTTREQRFGKSIDAVHAERDKHEQELKRVLGFLREMLRTRPFVCGKSAAYADYIVFGAFQWACTIIGRQGSSNRIPRYKMAFHRAIATVPVCDTVAHLFLSGFSLTRNCGIATHRHKPICVAPRPVIPRTPVKRLLQTSPIRKPVPTANRSHMKERG